MNSADWRTHGYRTVFIDSQVYLYRPLSGVTLQTSVDEGDWMRRENVNSPEWSKYPQGIHDPGICPAHRVRILCAAVLCYCDSAGAGGLCDYCAGVRNAEHDIRHMTDPPNTLAMSRARAAMGMPQLIPAGSI